MICIRVSLLTIIQPELCYIAAALRLITAEIKPKWLFSQEMWAVHYKRHHVLLHHFAAASVGRGFFHK